MDSYTSKIKYFAYIILAGFAFYINYFYANIGLYPIDTFSFFDSGYLVTQGYHPIKDFWVISGVLIDYLQALFFIIFGYNWNAYIYHSSMMNVLISVFFFFFLNNLRTNIYSNFFLSISFATLCYPVAGTPFPYQHAYIISLIAIMTFYLAVYKEEQKYWIILPVAMLFSFLSMQLPSGLINFLILSFILIYFLKFKKKFLSSFLLGSVISLLILLFYFLILKVNIKDFFTQIILFPLTIGEGRILGDERAFESANLFKRLTFRGTFGHFKFIIIFIFANLIATIFYLRKNKNHFFEKKVLLNIFIIFCGVSFIFHQLITANQTFIFSLIPFLCGLFLIQLKEYYKFVERKTNIFLILVIAFATIKYHKDYNVNRKFMDLQNINLNNSIEAKTLDTKFNNLKWITPHHFKNDSKKELKLLKDSIAIILNENNKEIALITHYQFFSILTEKKINIFNRWYFPDNNTHPVNKENKYYSHYNNKIYNFIKEKKIKKIYIAKSHPNEFQFINFKDLLKNSCFIEKKYNEILHSINIEKC